MKQLLHDSSYILLFKVNVQRSEETSKRGKAHRIRTTEDHRFFIKMDDMSLSPPTIWIWSQNILDVNAIFSIRRRSLSSRDQGRKPLSIMTFYLRTYAADSHQGAIKMLWLSLWVPDVGCIHTTSGKSSTTVFTNREDERQSCVGSNPSVVSHDFLSVKSKAGHSVDVVMTEHNPTLLFPPWTGTRQKCFLRNNIRDKLDTVWEMGPQLQWAGGTTQRLETTWTCCLSRSGRSDRLRHGCARMWIWTLLGLIVFLGAG